MFNYFLKQCLEIFFKTLFINVIFGRSEIYLVQAYFSLGNQLFRECRPYSFCPKGSSQPFEINCLRNSNNNNDYNTYYLYVSDLMQSKTCDTPTWNWSAIGGTHGLFSALRMLVPLYRSNLPVHREGKENGTSFINHLSFTQ